jgi:hypothetical protein
MFSLLYGITNELLDFFQAKFQFFGRLPAGSITILAMEIALVGDVDFDLIHSRMKLGAE